MAEYTYQFDDGKLDGFAACFESRVGDNSGLHEGDYFDMVKMMMSVKRQGSLLDIGAGEGRVTGMAKDIMAETIALEPDELRSRVCHQAYHAAPECQVLCQTSSEYMEDNPGKTFDLIIIGMVLQHLSTTTCEELLEEAAALLKPDGIGIIYTTHTQEATRGFSIGDGKEDSVYISKERFNGYAADSSKQTSGPPVRRFSKDEFLGCLAPHFDSVYWRQTSYYRKDRMGFFANRLGVEPKVLEDSGISQFAVVQKRA